MNRKIKIAWISAMVFTFVLLLFGGAKASADLGDYIEGDTPQVVENTAESYGFALSVALDVIQGEKSVPDAYAELVEYSINNGCDNLDLIINGGVIGVDMSPREFVNALTNGIRQGIADGGGQVSAFPVGNTNGDVKRFNLSDGTYVEWFLNGFQYNYCNDGYDYAWWGYNYYNADGGLIDTVHANSSSVLGSWADVPCYAPMGANIWDYVTISIAEVTDTNILWRIDKYVFTSAKNYYTNTKYITQKIENSGLTGEEVITTDDVDNLTDEELIILIDNMIDTLKEIDPNTEETNGLLQAILNQLEKLDSDDDNPLLRDILKKLNAISVGSNDSVLKKLDTIIEKLTSIDNNISELVEEDKTNAVAKWKDIIGLFEGYFKIPQLKSSANQISTILFGQRVYEQNEATQTMSVAIIGNGGNVISSVMPELGITYDGVKYPLYNLIYSCDSSELENIKQFISFFLIASFLVGLIRNVPTILQGGSILFPVHWENFTMDTSVRYATYKEDSITKGR